MATSSQQSVAKFVSNTRSMEIGPAMARRITWNGTTDEALALLAALSQHCDCRIEQGRILTVCASHTMLANDQRAVDGLPHKLVLADERMDFSR